MTAQAKVEQRHRDEARAFVDHAGLKQMALAQALANAEAAGYAAGVKDERERNWTLCSDRKAKGCWPEAGADVLVALWPWKDGEPCYVTEALFGWEGKENWRPTFRGADGDSLKNVYAWSRKPDAPPMPESLAAAIRARSDAQEVHDAKCESEFDSQVHAHTPCGCESRRAAR